MEKLHLDGWGLRWTDINGITRAKKNFYSINLKDILPIKFMITSEEDSNSLSFMFISRIDDLEITKTSFFDYNSMNIITFVTIKNIGINSLSNLYCKFLYHINIISFKF